MKTFLITESDMSRIMVLFLFFSIFLFPCLSTAQTLLTVVGNEDAIKTTWWPEMKYVQTDAWLRSSLETYGIRTIDPLQMSSVRFSPIVYASGPLTRSNAKSLGSLYHAETIINGSLKWSCQSIDSLMMCRLSAKLDLIRVRDAAHASLSFDVEAEAPTEALTKSYAIAMLASKLSTAYWHFVKKDSAGQGIPVYTSKPVLMLDALPDADTLVAFRKELKRLEGVTDVIERFVSKGALALEINPEVPQMTFSELENIVYQLTTTPQSQFVVHETRRTSAGIGIEIVNY